MPSLQAIQDCRKNKDAETFIFFMDNFVTVARGKQRLEDRMIADASKAFSKDLLITKSALFVLEDKWDSWEELREWERTNGNKPKSEREPKPRTKSKYTLSSGLSSREKSLTEEGKARWSAIQKEVGCLREDTETGRDMDDKYRKFCGDRDNEKIENRKRAKRVRTEIEKLADAEDFYGAEEDVGPGGEGAGGEESWHLMVKRAKDAGYLRAGEVTNGMPV